MQNPDIIKLIRTKMHGWDGMQTGFFHPQGGGGDIEELKKWAADMQTWANAVRRDILVLEYHLQKNCGVKPADLYGDPGDPPPPPE